MLVAADSLRTRLDTLIRRDDLAKMMLEMVDIPSPTGKEEAFARYLGACYAKQAWRSVTRRWSLADRMSLRASRGAAAGRP